MRSELHGPDVYLLKSKKPRIIQLVADAQNMTKEAIEKLDEKPDIIHGLIEILRKKELAISANHAESLADQMIIKNHPDIAYQLGLISYEELLALT